MNIVESSNPLNEKLTLQQVVDLAGKTEDYRFQWKIAAPVDGLPATVYQNTARTLLTDGTWNHVQFLRETDTPTTSFGRTPSRVAHDVGTSVSPVTAIPFTAVTQDADLFTFSPDSPAHTVARFVKVVMRGASGSEVFGTVQTVTAAKEIVVAVDPGQNVSLGASEIVRLYERVVPGRAQSFGSV